MLNIETQNYDFGADFGIRSFFVKPRWFHGGFKFSQLETTFGQEWFHAVLEVFFFLENVSIAKKDPNWAKIHHMLGFIENIETV